MNAPPLIAIDGPAGTGKSTLGELLAQRLGYLYFDTGVMYRAVTLIALQHQYNCTDAQAMEELAHRVSIDVVAPTENDGRQYTVLANGQDITWAIREPEIERHVSLVAKHPGVRAELIRQQRIIGKRGKVVMVGRDIGTIVAPDAPLKIYLQTTLAERARRRFIADQSRGKQVSLEAIESELARRDTLDQHVLYPASDACILHTDALTPHDGVDWVIAQFPPLDTHNEQSSPHE